MNQNFAALEELVASAFYEGKQSAKPKICTLHETMQSEEGNSHTCIACNFAEIVEGLSDVAKSMPAYSNSYFAKMTYLLWLYLLAERMQEIFKLIGLPEEIKEANFTAFIRAKRWGNFLKHPKAFFLTHHPKIDKPCGDGEVCINDAFVQKFYSGGNHNADLYRKLSNSRSVVVQFPNLEELTRDLASDLDELQKIVHENPIYQTVLRSKSVLENYYSAQSTNGQDS